MDRDSQLDDNGHGPAGDSSGRRGRVAYGRGIGDLLGELTAESAALVRAEIALARKEIEHKVDTVGKGVTSMATGGAVLYAGLLTLIAAVVLALAQEMDPWAAALIVGLIVCAVGAALLVMGRKNVKDEGMELPRTSRSLQQTKAMVQEQTS